MSIRNLLKELRNGVTEVGADMLDQAENEYRQTRLAAKGIYHGAIHGARGEYQKAAEVALILQETGQRVAVDAIDGFSEQVDELLDNTEDDDMRGPNYVDPEDVGGDVVLAAAESAGLDYEMAEDDDADDDDADDDDADDDESAA